MKHPLRKVLSLMRDIYRRSVEDEITALGAQLTYYLILSFFPFLIVSVALLSYLPVTREDFFTGLEQILPMDAYILVRQFLREIRVPERSAFLSFGTAATIFAASSGASALITGLNKAYKQKETRPFWKVKGVSLLFTLGLAMSILATFLLLILGKIFSGYVLEMIGLPDLFINLWNILRIVIPLFMVFMVITSMYHHIPNRRLRLKEVIPGALFSTLAWVLISLLFSLYVNHFVDFSRTYGSIGGIIVLLLWMYWSSMIVLLGGELNAALLSEKEEKKVCICTPKLSR